MTPAELPWCARCGYSEEAHPIRVIISTNYPSTTVLTDRPAFVPAREQGA
jgi:hypothetical protein